MCVTVQRESPARPCLGSLLGFSGARVSEVAQLRKQYVLERAGRWVMLNTPEADTTKTERSRIVPLHRQLVEDGFIDFVRNAPDGHLFVSPGDPQNAIGAVKGLTNRLRRFYRDLSPSETQPFHAWRHRFMTKTRELGCDGDLVRAVLGHEARDVSDRCGEFTVVALARVVDALPHIECGRGSSS